MSDHIWLAAVITDQGAEVQSVHDSREDARLACPEHGQALPLDQDACDALAAEHGILARPDGGGDESVMANDVLPDVWSDR